MRSQDYLNQAAKALRQAAVARKQEADDLTRQLDQMDHDARERINNLRLREGEELALAAQADSGKETANHTRAAQLGQIEESRINQQLNYDKRKLSQQLSDIQNSVTNLNRQAQDLENQAALGP